MKKKYFSRYYHDLKNSIIALQFAMEDHNNSELTDSEFLKQLNEIVKSISEQTAELNHKVTTI